MHKLKQLILFAVVICILTALFVLSSCTPPPPKELTQEQLQAIQDSIMQVKTDSLNLLWSLGYEHYKQKNYGNAKKYFRQVAFMDFMGLKDKRLQNVYRFLGTCYMQQEQANLDSAEWAYLRGIEQMPDYPYNYEMLGYIYKTRHEYDKAIDMYTTLTGLVPDTSIYLKELGDLYFIVNDCDDCIANYREAAAIDPNNTEIHEKLAHYMKECDVDPEKIIESLKVLVEQQPSNINHRIDLARNYMDILEFKNAVQQLEAALAIESDNIYALELSGKCYQETGQYSKAVNAYSTILLNNPDDKDNICNLAMSYSSLGQYTNAMNQVRKAQNIDPNYGLTFITKGMIYETAADKCSDTNNKISFDDKLTYELAYKEYLNANKDPQWKSEANKRIGYVKPLIPTKADIFMHKNQTHPEGPCYEWIQ